MQFQFTGRVGVSRTSGAAGVSGGCTEVMRHVSLKPPGACVDWSELKARSTEFDSGANDSGSCRPEREMSRGSARTSSGMYASRSKFQPPM